MRTWKRIACFLLLVLPSSGIPVWGAEARPSLRIESVVLRPMQEAEVPAQQTGLLSEIAVIEGEHVEAGQRLASLDTRRAKLAVVQAEQELAQAEAKAKNEISIRYADKALEVAQAELARSSDSIAEFAKSISQSQLDVERLTVEKLTLERQQAEHERVLERHGVKLKQTQLAAAKLLLTQHEITAPFAGTVVLLRGRVGEWVETGAPVLRLVATDRLRAEGFLPAAEASQDFVGKVMRLEVTLSAHRQHADSGTVRFVSPEMEPVTRQVRFWVEIPNEGNLLRPGQQGVLVFPVGAP